jgi:hypothetical protein
MMRHHSTENRCARRIAGWRRTMGIGKKNSPRSNFIKIWRQSLGMAIETTNPIIKIIDRYE